ncbi:MAG: hypothetical protein HC843_12625 [Sphingomonadales bacterium]|nr:hypothetical protein [Sphingomonadales bacterium]
MRTVPYIICRYRIAVDDTILSEVGQRQFFAENQGQNATYYTAGEKPNANALVMEFERIDTAKFEGLSFQVGYQPGYRRKTGYNPSADQRTFELVQDDHIKSAHVIAIPALGCMAIEDRNNENNIPQSIAVKGLRSILDFMFEDASFDVMHLTDGEVTNIVAGWELIQYDYQVRPLNPIRLSDFNELRSEAMKADRVAFDAGRLKPLSGETMQSSGGLVTETQQMVDAGYGQSGIRAITPEGDEARVPKAKFHMDKEKNFAEREKPRFLKIMFESDDGVVDKEKIVDTIGRFYGTD